MFILVALFVFCVIHIYICKYYESKINELKKEIDELKEEIKDGKIKLL